MRRLAAFDPLSGSGRSSGHEGVAFLIDHRDEDVRHRAVSLFRVCYGPFAADHRSGCKLGRRSQRPVGCHARMVQLPSDAPLPRLGQASFAVALVGSPVASRIASQAHPVLRDGCLTIWAQGLVPYNPTSIIPSESAPYHACQKVPQRWVALAHRRPGCRSQGVAGECRSGMSHPTPALRMPSTMYVE
jgi:hypothetical protein